MIYFRSGNVHIEFGQVYGLNLLPVETRLEHYITGDRWIPLTKGQ